MDEREELLKRHRLEDVARFVVAHEDMQRDRLELAEEASATLPTLPVIDNEVMR